MIRSESALVNGADGIFGGRELGPGIRIAVDAEGPDKDGEWSIGFVADFSPGGL